MISGTIKVYGSDALRPKAERLMRALKAMEEAPRDQAALDVRRFELCDALHGYELVWFWHMNEPARRVRYSLSKHRWTRRKEGEEGGMTRLPYLGWQSWRDVVASMSMADLGVDLVPLGRGAHE